MKNKSPRQQRKTKNLGSNNANKHEQVYEKLKSEGITLKKCNRSVHEPHVKYGFVHEGKNPLPVEEFNLQSTSKDGLQPNCKNCEKKFRRGRIEKNISFYAKMTDKEIYANYFKKYGLKYKTCGRCSKEKLPDDFPISRTMESGLHNMCLDCSENYRESVSSRWIVYTPDGHTVNKPLEAKFCVKCGCKEIKKLQFDHMWPIAKGGSDNVENLQVLCQKCNLAKKTDVSEFISINKIKKEQICLRYHNILFNAQKKNLSIRDFEIQISAEVQNHLNYKCSLSDEGLLEYFEEHKKNNNRKFSIKRAVDKYRNYCLRNSGKKTDKT